MERYARPTLHESRVFDELVELFPDDAYYDHFNSLLLGWDIGRQCRTRTLAAVAPILKELASQETLRLEPLLPRMGDLEERDVRRQKIASEFGWLQKGIDLAIRAKASN
jgi:hypothetical protein